MLILTSKSYIPELDRPAAMSNDMEAVCNRIEAQIRERDVIMRELENLPLDILRQLAEAGRTAKETVRR